MKITIYELLGLIKDGKAPMKFNYKNKPFYSVDNDYWCDEIGGWFSVEALDISILNDEVEIIEEDKKIEKLDLYCDFVDEYNNNDKLDANFKDIETKINELIEEIEKLKGKSE